MTAMVQRSFSGGELSPSLQARADLTRYQTGGRIFRNGWIKSDGGWQNRPGSLMVTETKNSGVIRKIEWEFNSDSLTYVLELGHHYMRFVRGGAQVTISTANAWSGLTTYAYGDIVVVAGIAYQCILAHTNHTPPNPTYWYALTDNIVEIETPWADTELADIQFTQDQNAMFLAHPSYPTKKLVRISHTVWYLANWSTISFGGFPAISTPTNLVASNSGNDVTYPADTGFYYAVTAVGTNGEESLPSSYAGQSAAPTTTDLMILSWTGVSGARGYNVYKLDNNGLGLLAFTPSTSFSDDGLVKQDTSETPPEIRSEVRTVTGFCPASVCFYQQRLMMARFENLTLDGDSSTYHVQSIYGSKIGLYHNFTKKFPILADTSLNFEIRAKKVQGVRHMVNLGKLIVFTDSGEWVLKGDANGILRTGEENPEQYSANGASSLAPLVVNSNALYVQKQGNMIRELSFAQTTGGRDGHQDTDISAMARHLFKGRTIVSWAYQKTPHSIVWIVFDDGEMVGVTYVREEAILACHRHDTDGLVEGVACIPEGVEHAVYITVKRSVNGAEKRYIERLASRDFTDIRDAFFVDGGATYDGRNTDDDHSMMLFNGRAWTAEEEMSLGSSSAYFTEEDVGNAIFLEGEDDDGDTITIHCTITEFVDDGEVLVKPDKDVPFTFQNRAITVWAKAVDQISGADHLEGEAVSIIADGYVVASPNNPDYPAYTIFNGELSPSLDKPYGVIHVGRPYISDLQTLDLETLQPGTIATEHKLVNEVTLYIEETRGVWAGGELPSGDDPLENLEEMKPEDVDYQGAPLQTGKVKIPLSTSWDKNGRTCVRQVDPLPITVNAIVPTGLISAGG
jgi:hypothetical protein